MSTSTAQSPKELLIAGRAKIADEKHWTTEEVARDAAGNPVEAGDPEAVCWCAYGALEGHSVELIEVAINILNDAAMELFEQQFAATVNDELGHAAVMRVYARAIELSEAA